MDILTQTGEIDIMPSRYVCDVLSEIRTAVKVGRIDMVIGLVEEIQTLVNRMEAKLMDYADMGYVLGNAKDFKKRLKSLREAADEVGLKLDEEKVYDC
jgi:hypothetical protein